MLGKIRALLQRSDTQSRASTLDRDIAQLDIEIAQAKAELVAAEAERPAALRGSDHAAAANRNRIDGLRDRLLLAADAQAGLVKKRNADLAAEPARKIALRKAKAASEAVSEKLRRRYPALCHELLGLLRENEEARILVEAANADLPAGAAPIDLPEAFRDIAAEPEKVTRTDMIERWVARPEFGGHAIDPATAKGFVDHGDGTGEFIARTYAGHSVLALAMKVVETVETILPWRGAMPAEPLRSMTLPALHAGAEGFALTGWGHSPEYVIAAIDKALTARVEGLEARTTTERKTSQVFGGSRHGMSGYQIPAIAGAAPRDPAIPLSAGKSGRVSTHINPSQQRTGGVKV